MRLRMFRVKLRLRCILTPPRPLGRGSALSQSKGVPLRDGSPSVALD